MSAIDVAALHDYLLAAVVPPGERQAPPGLDGVRELLADRARFTRASAELSRAFESWLRARNPFVWLSDFERNALIVVFARTLRALESGTPEAALSDHAARLTAWLHEVLGGLPPKVPSAEYSPELQLEVLGVEVADLQSPVLDVGCGESAGLVRHLRAQGVEAWGLDRAEAGAFTFAGDWLEFEYGRERWGTVISHQAFSLHFLHHHFRGGEAARRHGEAYAAILRGLRPGGAFVYVPALPFVESVLPTAQYRVERRPLPPKLAAGLEWVKQLDPELDAAFASRVVRKT